MPMPSQLDLLRAEITAERHAALDEYERFEETKDPVHLLRAGMRVLVACEFSGRVRDAFIRRGHDAWSCDLLPTEVPGPHIQGDVLSILGNGWDLMIAHPPCTHLAASGARWWKEKGPMVQWEALEFVRALLAAPIPKIALENPVGKISTSIRKPDQIIQPWQFGHPETKATCLFEGVVKTRANKRGRWKRNKNPSVVSIERPGADSELDLSRNRRGDGGPVGMI